MPALFTPSGLPPPLPPGEGRCEEPCGSLDKAPNPNPHPQGEGTDWSSQHQSAAGSGIHFGQERVPPCHALGEDLLDGTGLIIAGISAQWVSSLLDRLDCLQEHAPCRNDGAVGRSQVLL